MPNGPMDSARISSDSAHFAMPSKSRFFLELLLAIIVIRIPFISVPFKWLESYFHELSHGIATVLTAGSVSHIQLFPNGAGLCYSQGGWPIIIAFCGYFGAALWGYLIYNLATWQRAIRVSFACLAALVALTILLWARDLLTIVILSSLVLLLLLPLKLSHVSLLAGTLRVVAMMIMLNALASPLVLLGLSGRGDAVALAQMTWIPAWIWVAIWLAFSLWMLYLCWQRVLRHAAKSKSTKL
ncbi:M50 family metallopeptidase [Shewanella waksmanii]|uniref:M50 family metallopeptidase n=1 Tax=Shewanella waksmanii TaxID=213783 RepID=UPI00048F0832|nr:M50 family metallopeptidase [Shewanella waksmanii]